MLRVFELNVKNPGFIKNSSLKNLVKDHHGPHTKLQLTVSAHFLSIQQ